MSDLAPSNEIDWPPQVSLIHSNLFNYVDLLLVFLHLSSPNTSSHTPNLYNFYYWVVASFYRRLLFHLFNLYFLSTSSLTVKVFLNLSTPPFLLLLFHFYFTSNSIHFYLGSISISIYLYYG